MAGGNIFYEPIDLLPPQTGRWSLEKKMKDKEEEEMGRWAKDDKIDSYRGKFALIGFTGVVKGLKLPVCAGKFNV